MAYIATVSGLSYFMLLKHPNVSYVVSELINVVLIVLYYFELGHYGL